MKSNGFTLIEVVVSVSIALALFGSIIVNYNGHNDRQNLKQAALTLKNNFRFVQGKALGGEKPENNCTELVGWTITFVSNSYSMQAQCNPEGLQGGSTQVNFPSGITFNPIPSAVTFRVLSRGTTLETSTTIILSGFTKTYTLTVSPSGDISDLGLQ